MIFFIFFCRIFGNNFSLQLGAFVFGAVNLDQIPLVISGKFSLPKTTSIGIINTSFALGGMYVQIPYEFVNEDFGFGIAFRNAELLINPFLLIHYYVCSLDLRHFVLFYASSLSIINKSQHTDGIIYPSTRNIQPTK